MTYIGIRHRESRPLEPKGSQTQKSGRVRRKEEKKKGKDHQLEVDCGDFTFAVFFFSSFGQKQQRKTRGGGMKCLRVLAGFSASTQKQNGSVNKKRSLMLVSGTRPRASQARKQCRHSSASHGLL